MSRDFKPKKLPRQARSQRTFDAMIEACARLLVELGYGAVTTNHIAERAGVSIGSLYEYFPDKDTIVFEVVRRTTEGFSDDAAKALPGLEGMPVGQAIALWVDALLVAMRQRQDLLRAIVEEVPLTLREPHRRKAWARHLAMARAAYALAGSQVRQDRIDEVSFLVVTLVDATLTRLVLEPPDDLGADAVIDELVQRVTDWVTV